MKRAPVFLLALVLAGCLRLLQPGLPEECYDNRTEAEWAGVPPAAGMTAEQKYEYDRVLAVRAMKCPWWWDAHPNRGYWSLAH